MKISVIIAMYNGGKTIERCLDNLLGYESKSLEIIVIDDNSTDNSYKICSKYLKMHSNLILRKNDKKGVSSARNLGISFATGEIITFCDADDYFDIGAMEQVIKIFNVNHEINIVTVGYKRVDFEGNIIKKYCFEKEKIITAEKLIYLTLQDDKVMGSVWNKFFRSHLLKKIRFDETLSYCEDMHFVINVLSNNRKEKVYLLNKAIYNYVVNSTSVTNNYITLFDSNGNLKYINALNKIIELLGADKLNISKVKYCKVSICLNTIVAFNLSRFQRKYLKHEILLNIVPFTRNIAITNVSDLKKIVYILLVMLNLK